jgi:hypothetical protein
MKLGGNTAARSTAEWPRYSAARATETIESQLEFGSAWTDSLANPISVGRKKIWKGIARFFVIQYTKMWGNIPNEL